MKGESRHIQALTLIDVLVVIAILFVLAALFLPMLAGNGPSPRGMCTSNLKQIGMGFVMWTDDTKGQSLWQASVQSSGTLDSSYAHTACQHFYQLSIYLRDPRSLVCPLDKGRHVATNYASVTDQNISYFLNLDLSTNSPSASIVAGDRNLQANGQPVRRGLFVLTTNLDMGWTRELHRAGGNLAFADGHAEFIKTNRLNEIIRSRNPASNRLVVP